MADRMKLEIAKDVLRTMRSGPQRATHIMYKSNLAWNQAKFYLEFFVARGICAKEWAESRSRLRDVEKLFRSQQRRVVGRPAYLYSLTSKGYLLLKDFDSIVDILFEVAPEISESVYDFTTRMELQ